MGCFMTLAGAFLIYLSLKAKPKEDSESDDVYYIGSRPVMINSIRRLIIAALGVTSVVLVWLTYQTLNINAFGWLG